MSARWASVPIERRGGRLERRGEWEEVKGAHRACLRREEEGTLACGDTAPGTSCLQTGNRNVVLDHVEAYTLS